MVVNFDRGQEAQNKYMKDYKLPLAVANGSDEGQNIAARWGVRGIPSLIVVGPDGKTISEEGRMEVMKDAKGVLAKWQENAGPAPAKEEAPAKKEAEKEKKAEKKAEKKE